MDINEKVLLLGIYKKDEDETLIDIVIKLESNGLFNLKEGKRLLKGLKKEGFISDSSLSLKGELQAKEVENEFKL
ncbi:MAG: hypothetical protein ACQERD_11035 [Campylobacterota bacterium]